MHRKTDAEQRRHSCRPRESADRREAGMNG